MLSCLGRIHGCGERRLASFLSRGFFISPPQDWPRRPKQLFFVQPTKENLEIFDKMHRAILQRERLGDSEYFLSQQLVKEMPHPLAQKFPYVYLYEWAVQIGSEAGQVAGLAGQGDFVFASGDGRFAIVEVKYVDCRHRSRKRKLVSSQAQHYAALFRLAAKEAGVQLKSVTAFTYTNEDGLIYRACVYQTIEERLEEDPAEE